MNFIQPYSVVAMLTGILAMATVPAQAFQDKGWQLLPAANTHWLELVQGSELSKRAAGFRSGGFDSATGQWIGFDKWYRPKWADTRLTWMTQVAPELGVIWGASTGEQAEKYRTSPSLKLGFVYQHKLGTHSGFSIRATSLLGGRFRERACTADYGDVGGIVQVNCRLAATEMAPAETLKYLVNDLPPERHDVQIRYHFRF
jgi:hypothetical protein